MPQKQNSNLDEDLRQRVGHDATSTFESDPTFTGSDPTADAGSENLGARDEAAGSAAGESLSGNTSRHSNQLENDEGPSLDEDESTVNRDTGEDSRDINDITAEAEEEGAESSTDEEVDGATRMGNQTPSQDETRLEGGAQSARGRGSRKSPRQAA